MADLVNISLPTAGVTALLGYAVVFFALVLLMAVLLLMGRVMARKKPAAESPAPAAPAPEKSLPLAPGSAGEVKLYDTDPRTAAMLIAAQRAALYLDPGDQGVNPPPASGGSPL